MLTADSASPIKQLDGIIQTLSDLQKRARYDDLSDLPDNEHQKLLTQCQAAVVRISGADSVYAKQIEVALRGKIPDGMKCFGVVGVVEALRSDLEAGYIRSLTELIHGELFGDYLEMAEHLLDEGYKDAAAVITGGTLEGHLRQLCKKHGIPITSPISSGAKPKKSDQLNSELAAASAYSKLDQKNVTAWLDLRNKAAHGEYSLYSRDQVALFVTSVRDFLTRVPA